MTKKLLPLCLFDEINDMTLHTIQSWKLLAIWWNYHFSVEILWNYVITLLISFPKIYFLQLKITGWIQKYKCIANPIKTISVNFAQGQINWNKALLSWNGCLIGKVITRIGIQSTHNKTWIYKRFAKIPGRSF